MLELKTIRNKNFAINYTIYKVENNADLIRFNTER